MTRRASSSRVGFDAGSSRSGSSKRRLLHERMSSQPEGETIEPDQAIARRSDDEPHCLPEKP
jgi:hypothetical protein